MIDFTPLYPPYVSASLMASSYCRENSLQPASVFSRSAISGSIRKIGTTSIGSSPLTSSISRIGKGMPKSNTIEVIPASP